MADRERLRGYAVTGLPFRTGHLLAMRRFPASSIGPGYTSVWHRDPTGRLVIYQDQAPRFGCPRAFGPMLDEALVVPISLEWTGPQRFRMEIDSREHHLHWDVALAQNVATRALNAFARILPRAMRYQSLVAAAAGRVAGPLLRAGRVRLAGKVPSGPAFLADLRQVLLIDRSSAVVDGVDLGTPGRFGEQLHLRDFWLPQRGLFGFADALFEPYDPARHQLVASRQES